MEKEKIEAFKIIKEILKENKTMTLITKNGEVWASKVYFAESDGYIYSIIESSKNFQNLLKNKEVFFVIERGIPDRFIQGNGKCEILGSPEEEESIRKIIFRKVFEVIPFVKKVGNLHIVRIKPEKLFLSDFTKGWKPREEIEIGENYFEIFKTNLKDKYNKFFIYFKATRPFAFTASFISVCLGAFLSQNINFFFFLQTLFVILFIHAGVNVLNDYMDYIYGADDWLTIGASRVLQDGLMSKKESIIFSIILLITGSSIGIILTLLRGFPILLIGIIGGLLGVFYQLKPIGLKYRALGDIAVFLGFGPLLVLGSYYVQAQNFSWVPIWLSIPVGLLVIGILHANNFRDIEDDVKSGYKTVAGLLGAKLAPYYYLFLVSLSYILVLIFIVMKIISPWTLLVFLSIPLAKENVKVAFNPGVFVFGMLDLFTAKLHLVFGLLLLAGIIIPRVF